jgi:Lrp/AsnC family transcriptional regulator, cysteine-sensing transcriptional activator
LAHYCPIVDEIDRKILQSLQDDATVTTRELGEQVGLSSTACWRRVQQLEADGVIRRRVALLDRHQLNLGVLAYMFVSTRQHDAAWLERFRAAIDSIPEILEVYRLSGQTDYLLRLAMPDIATMDDVYLRLIDRVELSDVSTNFVMEEMKSSTALPLTHVVTD